MLFPTNAYAEAELLEMIERADADNDGEVTQEDFFNVCMTGHAAFYRSAHTFRHTYSYHEGSLAIALLQIMTKKTFT